MKSKASMTNAKQMSAASKARTALHGIAADLPVRPFVPYKVPKEMQELINRSREYMELPSVYGKKG